MHSGESRRREAESRQKARRILGDVRADALRSPGQVGQLLGVSRQTVEAVEERAVAKMLAYAEKLRRQPPKADTTPHHD